MQPIRACIKQYSLVLYTNSDDPFIFQGLPGYPGAKGDEGPKGEDVSEINAQCVCTNVLYV